MDFFDVLEKRRSVRAFTGQQISRKDIEKILAAANSAPSAGNLQAFEIYLVAHSDLRSALAQAALDQEFVARAPLVLVFCAHARRSAGKYGERGSSLYCVQDATIACTYAMLAVTALELSTVWVGAFDEVRVRGIINAPQAHWPVALLPIGYPAEVPVPRSRRQVAELVHEM